MPKSIHLYRNKEKARAYQNAQRKKNYERGGFVEQVRAKRRIWTSVEDQILLQWTKTYRELAKILRRSVQGITKRKWILSKTH